MLADPTLGSVPRRSAAGQTQHYRDAVVQMSNPVAPSAHEAEVDAERAARRDRRHLQLVVDSTQPAGRHPAPLKRGSPRRPAASGLIPATAPPAYRPCRRSPECPGHSSPFPPHRFRASSRRRRLLASPVSDYLRDPLGAVQNVLAHLSELVLTWGRSLGPCCGRSTRRPGTRCAISVNLRHASKSQTEHV